MKIFTTLALIAPVVCFSADLTTNSGKTYKNYTVRRVTENGIQIFHSQGGCIVQFDDLPDDVRAKYRSQEEQILAEQKRKKAEEERQRLLRKKQAERRKLLINIELISYDEIKVLRVIDSNTCLCYFSETGQDLIVTGINTANIADGSVLPCLDTYYLDTHNFNATFTRKNGKFTLDSWQPVSCFRCGMKPPKISDREDLAIALYILQDSPCKRSKTSQRHHLYYVGMRIYRNTKYMVFTASKKTAVKYAKANPTIRIPKLKEARSRISTPVYRPVSSPGFSAPVQGISPYSSQGQMLQGRSFY